MALMLAVVGRVVFVLTANQLIQGDTGAPSATGQGQGYRLNQISSSVNSPRKGPRDSSFGGDLKPVAHRPQVDSSCIGVCQPTGGKGRSGTEVGRRGEGEGNEGLLWAQFERSKAG